jgi:hypothetical protein
MKKSIVVLPDTVDDVLVDVVDVLVVAVQYSSGQF